MNWFKNWGPLQARKMLDEGRAEGCEHVEANHALAHSAVAECDSFGPDTPYVECEACAEKRQAERDNMLVTCHQCNKQVKQGETREWRWYDFYAAQGDEALVLCKECLRSDRHAERVARDNYEYNEEFGTGEPDYSDNDDEEPEEYVPVFFICEKCGKTGEGFYTLCTDCEEERWAALSR